MNNQPIGVLDSGVGGLSILKEIVRKMPNEATVYIGDSKNCPYGNKSTEEIYRLAHTLVEFLISKQCKIIVLACNTITVTCLDKLREEFKNIPIIGTVPVVKTAAQHTKNGKIGILSTPRTAESSYQQNLIKLFANDCTVINLGTDKLVPLVEAGKIDNAEDVLKEVLQPFIDAEVDTLALGCSHFPFFMEQMQKILGSHIKILDSAGAIARQVRRVLTQEGLLSTNHRLQHDLYTTGNTDQFSAILRSIRYNGSVKNIEL